VFGPNALGLELWDAYSIRESDTDEAPGEDSRTHPERGHHLTILEPEVLWDELSAAGRGPRTNPLLSKQYIRSSIRD